MLTVPDRLLDALTTLTPDERLLFGARTVRLFAYGFLSVVLVLYLAQVGLTEAQIGLLLTLTLLGDTLVSLWITTVADRLGRRRMLLAGALLMLAAGIVFGLTNHFLLLLVAATVGVISPSGNEVGPFLPIEQAALAQMVTAARRTQVFAWYNLIGSFATALGSLCGGLLTQALQSAGRTPLDSYRAVVLGYGTIALGLAFLFSRLSARTETPSTERGAPSDLVSKWLGLSQSRSIVLRLSTLFALDSFGGGFVVQSIVAYWFYLRFGVEPALLGSIFFAANLLAGVSALLAVRVAAKIGLINTMVVTHLPSNVLLMLVPL
ncbi:MAG: MFS transporter, partial [Anaerolineae bacterium]|nr:MFS transporter [Anaerolineae bacterium]